jgi:hypothetical protein
MVVFTLSAELKTLNSELITMVYKLTIVPCAPGVRKACDLLREALQRLVAARPELQVVEAEAPDLSSDRPILAIDSSRECRAGEILKARRIKPAATLYLPEQLAARRLPDPGQPITAQWDKLREGVLQAITEEVDRLLALQQEEAAYFEEMAAVIQRYLKETTVVEAAGAPSEQLPALPQAKQARVLLAANRFRNLFMRCDEITPPAALATTHDVFQDACMCMTYAVQHWERGEWQKAADYLEQAGHQAGPLLRYAQGKR